MIWIIVWVVLMVLWLFGGGYILYTPEQGPKSVGNHILAWLCVAILGAFVFGAVDAKPMQQQVNVR
jgi:hypothetical protein